MEIRRPAKCDDAEDRTDHQHRPEVLLDLSRELKDALQEVAKLVDDVHGDSLLEPIGATHLKVSA